MLKNIVIALAIGASIIATSAVISAYSKNQNVISAPILIPDQDQKTCFTMLDNMNETDKTKGDLYLDIGGTMIEKFKEFVVKKYNIDPAALVPFDTVQAFKFHQGTSNPEDDVVLVVLYNKGCQVNFFTQDLKSFDTDMKEFMELWFAPEEA